MWRYLVLLVYSLLGWWGFFAGKTGGGWTAELISFFALFFLVTGAPQVLLRARRFLHLLRREWTAYRA